jgi:hypothetical protein
MTNTTYNYRESIKADIEEMLNNGDFDYIVHNYTDEEWNLLEDADKEELEQELYDAMWACDGITGNASGSYTFSTYQAEENLCHNLDLLADACDYFGSNTDILKDGAEACDVTIRCLLLGECLSEVLNEMLND